MKLKLGTRKAICLGNSFFISIPMVWAKAHGLKKGDTLTTTITDDGSISYTNSKEDNQNEKT